MSKTIDRKKMVTIEIYGPKGSPTAEVASGISTLFELLDWDVFIETTLKGKEQIQELKKLKEKSELYKLEKQYVRVKTSYR